MNRRQWFFSLFVILHHPPVTQNTELPWFSRTPPHPRKLRELSRDEIAQALRLCHGDIRKTARHLNVSRRALAYRIKNDLPVVSAMDLAGLDRADVRVGVPSATGTFLA